MTKTLVQQLLVVQDTAMFHALKGVKVQCKHTCQERVPAEYAATWPVCEPLCVPLGAQCMAAANTIKHQSPHVYIAFPQHQASLPAFEWHADGQHQIGKSLHSRGALLMNRSQQADCYKAQTVILLTLL